MQSSLNENLSFDSAEFLAWCLDGYERNISVLNSHLQETFPEEEQLLSDLGSLIRINQQQREFCEALSFRNFFLEEQSGVRSLVRVSRSGIGRPTVELSQVLQGALHNNVGFSWAQIACNRGIFMTMILIKLSAKFYIHLELGIGLCKVHYVIVA